MHTATLATDSNRHASSSTQVSLVDISSPMLAITAFGVLRAIGTSSFALVKQRPVIQQEGATFGWKENAIHAATIALYSPQLFAATTELVRRAQAGESLAKLKRGKQPQLLNIVSASSLGTVLAVRGITGKSLINNKPLTSYGRVSNILSAVQSALRLGIHLRETSPE